MSNELFTDLSVEQQEVVAGGVDVAQFTTYASLLNVSTTSIKAVGPVASASGSGGSAVLSTGAASFDAASLFATLGTGSAFLGHA